jgi:dinuclear metal center YbgI/SA1388 family protein
MNKKQTSRNHQPHHVSRTDVVSFLDDLLNIRGIEDYSRNGLQVQGAPEISRVAVAVDGCLEAYEEAAAADCQMLVVHHGMIWGGLPAVTGATYRQLRVLLDHGVSLYAAHLPLDLHPKYGNNAQIAAALKLTAIKPFGSYKGVTIGYEGRLAAAVSIETLAQRLESFLGGLPLLFPFGKKEIRTVAIVSGRASEIIEDAIAGEVDCFITGEPKHEHFHRAKEAGLNVIYCGHYFSEKPGVIALGVLLKKKFAVETVFLDIPTMV